MNLTKEFRMVVNMNVNSITLYYFTGMPSLLQRWPMHQCLSPDACVRQDEHEMGGKSQRKICVRNSVCARLSK